MAKLWKQKYRDLKVNWHQGLSPLDTKMLDRVLVLMDAAVEKKNIKPILSRFDFPNTSGVMTSSEEVAEFFKLIKEKMKQINCYFKISGN